MLAVYTLSSKKRNVLVDPNKYEYNLQSMSRDKSKSFWNCVEKRKHSKCVATAVVNESDNIIISLSKNHNHNINHAKCSASAIEKKHISNAVANPDIPGRSVLVNLASEMNRSAPLVAANMSNKTTLVRKIRYERAKAEERPKVPKSAQEFFNLPDRYTKSSDGGDFLRSVKFVDKAETKVMLLFISQHGINVLKTCTTLQGDGTFSTCPDGFGQLYFLFGCTQSGKAIPAAFALLPNKAMETYVALFTAVKEAVGDMRHVTHLCVDFETAVHTAFKKLFPTSAIIGCIFHMRQAVHRQLGHKGVGALYNDSETFQEAVALFYSLAFVPEADVENVFYDVIMPFWDQHLESWEEEFGAGECVENVGNYMETTYVVHKTRKGTRPAMFPISTWNKHSALVAEIGDSPLLLTNNSLEAFNSRYG